MNETLSHTRTYAALLSPPYPSPLDTFSKFLSLSHSLSPLKLSQQTSACATAMASSEEPPRADEPAGNDAVLHKTKTIQFFGRSTPVVLQNDNGPCPLLAICNVLLLRNQLNLNPDISEVSQEKLLSLVAERLIDSNSNSSNKDAGYVENQQQNIADAIDLLPRLTTGIDVNIKFRRIDDFEFTPECAIFDLLDIPLYHGWLVDPQDYETAEAIGSKSYNTLMGDLVSLETRKMESEGKGKSDEDCIDFAAATTAALGVPSPSLSRGRSFDDSPRSVSSDQQTLRKGDAEEEAELLRVLKLSESDSPSTQEATPFNDGLVSSDESVHMLKSNPASSVHVSEGHELGAPSDVEPSVSSSDNLHKYFDQSVPFPEDQAANLTLTDDSLASTDDGRKQNDQLVTFHHDVPMSNGLTKCNTDTLILDEATPSSTVKDAMHDREVENLCSPAKDCTEDMQKNVDLISDFTGGHLVLQPSIGADPSVEVGNSFTPSINNGEPMYEGEECILDSGKIICEDREPVYEGEMVLAEQADKEGKDASNASPKVDITLRQGELINNFLKNNASQLTFFGLFCLQEGLKERELCVFFRNNHFSTMFKLEGALYLLATDQGYMNQPDLVWEKLNEVNGDTLFMTSNFKEFRLESSSNSTWDQQNAVASTADYLASIDSSATDGSNMNSDLQLAIALQQQEFKQQQQQQQQRNPQQPSGIGSSRLITGPQVPRSIARPTSSTQKPDQKSKDKSNCKIM